MLVVEDLLYPFLVLPLFLEFISSYEKEANASFNLLASSSFVSSLKPDASSRALVSLAYYKYEEDQLMCSSIY